MKFAAARQQEVKQQGAAALETSLGFDQKAILEANLDYITRSLGAFFFVCVLRFVLARSIDRWVGC